MRRRTLSWCVLAAVCGAVSSGCASASLKEANRRLKEANERLIAENNRLQEELDQLQRNLAAKPAEAAPVTAAANIAPSSAPPSGDVERDLLIEGLRRGGVGDEVDVTRSGVGLHVRIPDRIFFAPGQAKLSSQGQAVLRRIAKLLNTEYRGHIIRVDGHTDDVPVRKVRHLYPTNWELSTARACTVVRYLVDQCGVDPRRIYPAGFSYYRPLASGKTQSARSRNRRVEITILDQRL